MSQVYACPLSHQVISLSGADKLSYLHGQITQDLNKLDNNNFLWAGHCSAKGKLWGVFKLFSYQQNYYLVEVDILPTLASAILGPMLFHQQFLIHQLMDRNY